MGAKWYALWQGGTRSGRVTITTAYRGTLQIPACVEMAGLSHTACLQRQGRCSRAKQSKSEALKLGLADDCSYLCTIKVALPLTKTLCPA